MLLARVFYCSYVVVLINGDSHGDYGLGLTDMLNVRVGYVVHVE